MSSCGCLIKSGRSGGVENLAILHRAYKYMCHWYTCSRYVFSSRYLKFWIEKKCVIFKWLEQGNKQIEKLAKIAKDRKVRKTKDKKIINKHKNKIARGNIRLSAIPINASCLNSPSKRQCFGLGQKAKFR